MAANLLSDFERLHQGVIHEIDRSSRTTKENGRKPSNAGARDVDAEVASMVSLIQRAIAQAAALTETVEKQDVIIEQQRREIDDLTDAQAATKRSYLDQLAATNKRAQDHEAEARSLRAQNDRLMLHLETLMGAIRDFEATRGTRLGRDNTMRFAVSA